MVRTAIAMAVLLSAQGWSDAARGETIPPLPEQNAFELWQREQGLPQVSVLAIVQDDRGYLWLATEEGLVRFDGIRFTLFDRDNTPAIGSSYVEALVAGRDGGVWIATRAGLNRFEDGRFTSLTSADGLVDDGLQALYQDRGGQLWIGTAAGLSHLDGEALRNYTTADGLPHDTVWAIHEDRQGRLWIGTEGGLSRFDPARPTAANEGGNRFTTYTTSQGLPHNHVQALYEDRQGRFWVGTLRGIVRFEDGSFIPVALREDGTEPWVYTFLEDRSGNLWIGTDDGLKRLRNGVRTSYTTAEGLPDNEVRTLLEDREGSLWFGTRHGGLGRLRKGKFSHFGTPEGLVDDVVWTIYQDRASNVWIGTNHGLTRLGAGGAVTSYTTADGLPGIDVRSLLEDREGDLWIGTYAHGLARLEDGKFRTYTTADGLAAPGVLGIQQDRHGTLWIATDGGGLNRFKDGRFTTYDTGDGVAGNVVKGLHQDDRGLWIGTESGLTRYRNGSFTAFEGQRELADHRVRSIYDDGEGNLWIGTRQGGLSLYREGKITNFSVADGLFDHVAHLILEDDQGRLWITSNKGLSHVRKAELLDFAAGRISAIHSVAYSEADGLRTSEFNGGSQPAGTKTRDGRLWFPTIKGVAVLDPAKLTINEVPPPVRIEEVLVDQRTVAAGPGDRRAELAPGAREFEFRYTALSFLAPERIRFRYRLEGFDDDWVEAGNRRTAFYTNLTPGSYRFRVIAANADGVWNEVGDAAELFLRPAFHQTWFFAPICLLAAALLAAGIYRLRVTGLLRRTLELQSMQDELLARNAEVETRNAEMERFIYTVSHDLKTPLVTIKGFLGYLRRDAAAVSTDPGAAERVDNDVARIGKAADTMHRLLEDLLELSRIGRLMNPPEAVALSELAEEAAELCAGRITEHGVAVAIDPAMPSVEGDRLRLLEVYQNLIDNAAKFLGEQPAPRVEIGARKDSGEVLCWVRDNGAGIDPRYLEKVFGLFERLDPEVPGTGVGLALVKRIVEVHGGRSWVESQGAGRGCTFYFTLPAAATAGTEPQTTPARPRR